MTQTFPVPQIPPPLRPRTKAASLARRFGSARAVMALVLREMNSTYGRLPGGYVWAPLEPIGALSMFTLIISAGLRLHEPSIDTSFHLFFASGILPFFLYRGLLQKVAASLALSRTLLLYPSVTFVDAILARFLLQVLTHSAVLIICMGAIMLLFETRALPSLPPILASFVMSSAIGLGMINAMLFPLYPLWKSVWES